MSDTPNNKRLGLLSLADDLAEDLWTMTDQEVLAEAAEIFGDVNAEVTRLRELASKANASANRSKLVAAQNALRAERRGDDRDERLVDLTLVRQPLAELANSNDQARENILLAAREASVPLDELPEDELRGIYDDMRELGFFDDDL